MDGLLRSSCSNFRMIEYRPALLLRSPSKCAYILEVAAEHWHPSKTMEGDVFNTNISDAASSIRICGEVYRGPMHAQAHSSRDLSRSF